MPAGATAPPAAIFPARQRAPSRPFPSRTVVTSGADRLGSFRSSSFGRRRFCRDCGAQLTIQVNYQPETIDFPIGSLDDPDPVVPGFHIFHASKVDWFETADDLPRHARFRPDTHGLNRTEPPE